MSQRMSSSAAARRAGSGRASTTFADVEVLLSDQVAERPELLAELVLPLP